MSAVEMARAAAGLALLTWMGGTVLCACRPGLRREPAVVRLVLGFGTGAGCLAGGMFLLGVLHVPFDVGRLLALQAAILGAGVLGSTLGGRGGLEDRRAFMRRLGDALLPFAPAPKRGRAPVEDTPASRAAAKGMLLLTALVLAVTAVLSVREKASFVDARTIWMLKARVFYLDRGFDGIYFQEWTDPAERRTYPPLFPICGAYVHFLCGEVNDGALKLLQAAFAAGLCVLLYRFLAHRIGAARAAAAVLLFTLCGQTVTLTVWGTADLALAFYLFSALWSLLPEGEGGPSPWTAGLFCACAAFTKTEGAVAWIGLAAAYLWCAKSRRNEAARPPAVSSRVLLPALTAAPLLAVLAWRLYCRHRGLEEHLLDRAPLAKLLDHPGLILDRLAVTAGFYAREFLSPRWLWAWPLFLAAAGKALLIRRETRWKEEAWIPLFVLLLLAAYGAVYLLLSPKVEWYARTSIGRIFYHVFPAAYAWTLVQWARRRGRGHPVLQGPGTGSSGREGS